MQNEQKSDQFPYCIEIENSVFKHLTEAEKSKISLESTCSEYERGAIIYRQGQRINGFYCVQDGILKIYKTGIDGKEQIITFAQKGNIIAYRSVLSQELACTTAEVLENATLCYIPGNTLFDLIKNNGSFSLDLLQLVCRELEEANSYITDIAQKTVRERLAEIIIHLKETFNVDKDNILNISLTREELANIVGTATESVIRLLSEFKADKLIELQGRKIKILDSNGLYKIANLFS